MPIRRLQNSAPGKATKRRAGSSESGKSSGTGKVIQGTTTDRMQDWGGAGPGKQMVNPRAAGGTPWRSEDITDALPPPSRRRPQRKGGPERVPITTPQEGRIITGSPQTQSGLGYPTYAPGQPGDGSRVFSNAWPSVDQLAYYHPEIPGEHLMEYAKWLDSWLLSESTSMLSAGAPPFGTVYVQNGMPTWAPYISPGDYGGIISEASTSDVLNEEIAGLYQRLDEFEAMVTDRTPYEDLAAELARLTQTVSENQAKSDEFELLAAILAGNMGSGEGEGSYYYGGFYPGGLF